jgi:hypothetical protein
VGYGGGLLPLQKVADDAASRKTSPHEKSSTIPKRDNDRAANINFVKKRGTSTIDFLHLGAALYIKGSLSPTNIPPHYARSHGRRNEDALREARELHRLIPENPHCTHRQRPER